MPLRSHLTSYDLLADARYADAPGKALVGEDLRKKLLPDFERFLEDRAGRVMRAISLLVEGKEPTVGLLWSEPAAGTAMPVEV